MDDDVSTKHNNSIYHPSWINFCHKFCSFSKNQQQQTLNFKPQEFRAQYPELHCVIPEPHQSKKWHTYRVFHYKFVKPKLNSLYLGYSILDPIPSFNTASIMSHNPGTENPYGFPSTPVRRNCPPPAPLQGFPSSTSTSTPHHHHQDHYYHESYLPPHTPRTPSTATAYGYMGSTNSLSQDSHEEENSFNTTLSTMSGLTIESSRVRDCGGFSTFSGASSIANMELLHRDATQTDVDMFYMRHCSESVHRLRNHLTYGHDIPSRADPVTMQNEMNILNHAGSGPLVNKIISKLDSEKAVDVCLRNLEGMLLMSHEREAENIAAKKKKDLQSLKDYEEDFKRSYNAWMEKIRHEHALMDKMIIRRERVLGAFKEENKKASLHRKRKEKLVMGTSATDDSSSSPGGDANMDDL
jgi:hypothetical protein